MTEIGEIREIDTKIENLKKQIKIFEQQKFAIENKNKLFLVEWIEVEETDQYKNFKTFHSEHCYETEREAELCMRKIKTRNLGAQAFRVVSFNKPRN
jgi:hypothetical protein